MASARSAARVTGALAQSPGELAIAVGIDSNAAVVSRVSAIFTVTLRFGVRGISPSSPAGQASEFGCERVCAARAARSNEIVAWLSCAPRMAREPRAYTCVAGGGEVRRKEADRRRPPCAL